MPFRIQAEFKGLAPFVRKLDGLRKGLRNKALRSAMRKSASVVNKKAKAAVTVGETGQLKRSLGVKVKVYSSGVVVGVVEPRPGFRVPVPVKGSVGRAFAAYAAGAKTHYHNPRMIAHLVEGGTNPRTQKTTGRYTGAAFAKPFLYPALTSSEPQVMQIFAEEVDKALAEAAR